MDVLKLDNFSYCTDGRHVLHNIVFSLCAGDWLSIIGPNGAGKSTLLKCILGLNGRKSNAGIYWHGHALSELSPRQIAHEAAYMPQLPTIPPFSVREFISLSRYAWSEPSCGSSNRERIERALAVTSMAAYADTSMQCLSGGNLKKAFLAAALAQNTDTLVLDEPFAFLDPGQAKEMNELLRKINRKEGKTVVMATHDLNLAMESGGLCLVLRAGVQMAIGPIDQFPGRCVFDEAFGHGFNYIKNPVTGKIIAFP